MQGTKTAKVLSVLCCILLACTLLFRAFGYSRVPLVQGDPTGVSDLIEFALGGALLLVLAISGTTAVVMGVKGPRQLRVSAAWLGALVILIAVAAGPLHAVVARWALA